jgi:hypothetical protein
VFPGKTVGTAYNDSFASLDDFLYCPHALEPRSVEEFGESGPGFIIVEWNVQLTRLFNG